MKQRNLLIIGLSGTAALLALLEIDRRRRSKTNALKSFDARHAMPFDDVERELELVSGNASMSKVEEGEATILESEGDPVVDDRGTDQFTASQILKQVRDDAFDSSSEKLAMALGRPTEEIEQGIGGESVIDGDLLMKVRALAMHRGVETEEKTP